MTKMLKDLNYIRERNRKKMAAWRAANPEKARAANKRRKPTKAQIKAWNLKRYGLTIAGFEAMWEGQARGCAACGSPCLGKREPVVDHCHATGRVRALLCLPCNTALGLLKESPERMRALIAYIEKLG